MRQALSTDTLDGVNVVKVVHEAFLSEWPPLEQAIRGAGRALHARRQVEAAAEEWGKDGQLSGRLWEGGQLATALADFGTSSRPVPRTGHPTRTTPGWHRGWRRPRRWLPSRHRALIADKVDLSPQASRFLRASIRTDRRRRARAVTVLSGLLVLALAAADIAVNRQQTAQEQVRITTARQLITQADAARDSDPRTALRLGIAAQRIHPDGQTRASLVHTLTATHYAGTLTGHDGAVKAVAFSRDGRTLASAGADRTVILWDLADRAAPRRLGGSLPHDNEVFAVAFSRDGRTLASAGADRTVILWDLADRAHPVGLGAPLRHDDPVTAVAFAPDGCTLANASTSMVRLWDLAELNALRRHPAERACSLTGGGLDRGEWALYISGLPYQNTCP